MHVLSAEDLRKQIPQHDIIVTNYALLRRDLEALQKFAFRAVILDEAQAIKNPNARQTKAAKALKARARIVLTGTPVENHFGDLWSIFDFINPGLLGNAKQFTRYTKRLAERTHNPYGPLRELVRPYILRRMKTDKSVIAELPDKTEIKALWQITPPDLTRSMEAKTPAIEESRESLGLLIITAWMLVVAIAARRSRARQGATRTSTSTV